MRSFIATILLAIISLYYVNSTMFSHVHVIDGATIIHSHFYGADHIGGNTCDTSDTGSDTEGDTSEGDDSAHTEGELTLIQHLNNIILLKSDITYSAELTPVEENALYIPTSIHLISQGVIGLSSPRAPPVV